MLRQTLCSDRWVMVLCLCLASLALMGCFSSNSLPSTVLVELPDGTTVEVDQGAGAPSLANSSWRFFRTSQAAQGISFVTISFGEGGTLERFDNNTIAQDLLGSIVLFDGDRHATNQQGIEYAASTFGAETNDGTGFSFEGRVTAFFVGLAIGGATANATGTFDPDDPDIMMGTFSYETEVNIPIPLPIEGLNQKDEFPFLATRVVEDQE